MGHEFQSFRSQIYLQIKKNIKQELVLKLRWVQTIAFTFSLEYDFDFLFSFSIFLTHWPRRLFCSYVKANLTCYPWREQKEKNALVKLENNSSESIILKCNKSHIIYLVKKCITFASFTKIILISSININGCLILPTIALLFEVLITVKWIAIAPY